MMAFPISIQIEEPYMFPNKSEILLSKYLLKELGLPKNQRILISFGVRGTSTSVEAINTSKSIMLISRSLANRLLIPFNMTLNVWYSEKQTLELGPILGILVSHVDDDAQEPFGDYTSFCSEACDASHVVHSFCYVTTLENIATEDGMTSGWTKQNGIWTKADFPLPHAFYNRILSRSKEKSGPFLKQFQSLKEQDVVIFNERFLNKWEVHQTLINTSIAKYLPVTFLCSDVKTIQRMLKSHPILFVKPIYGSEGKGIIRIRRVEQGYLIDKSKNPNANTQFFANTAQLIKSIAKMTKRISYLIQQGIPFIQSEGSTIDFRALLQKSRFGNWRVVSLIARTGSPQTFVSNLYQGGNLTGATTILKNLKNKYRQLPTPNQIKLAAREIATVLDDHLEGMFGELGIDLGVDQTGRIWLIEVNSKPSKKDNAVLATTKRPRPSILHLFEYVFYLANYPETMSKSKGRKNPGPSQVHYRR